ncbi:hypothetical protein KPL70_018884 [Citrus sinensis]|nr:hypothetical protein KPL70_018884 [Citrus sinensis]
MDLIPNYNSSERYWRRRGYQKLNDARKKNVTQALEDWRIKAVPKLCFNIIIASPLRLWTKFRNAYIRKMNNLAGKVGSLNNESAFGTKRIPNKVRQGARVVYSSEEIEFLCKKFNG